MVGRERLELSANGLKGRCSTIELPTRVDAREGVEPSITLLQRVVLPFDHPACWVRPTPEGVGHGVFPYLFVKVFTLDKPASRRSRNLCKRVLGGVK